MLHTRLVQVKTAKKKCRFSTKNRYDVCREKTRMLWLLEGEKNLKMFIRFDRDRWTPHDRTGHTCIALRGKKIIQGL